MQQIYELPSGCAIMDVTRNKVVAVNMPNNTMVATMRSLSNIAHMQVEINYCACNRKYTSKHGSINSGKHEFLLRLPQIHLSLDPLDRPSYSTHTKTHTHTHTL